MNATAAEIASPPWAGFQPPDWAVVARRYDVIERRIFTRSGGGFLLAQIRDVNVLVDGMDAEDFGEDERLPYWASLWPASCALAERVSSGPETLGLVLEFGCGLGLAGIAAARRGARVLLTDYEPDALAFALRNAELNSVVVDVALLDVRHPASLGTPKGNFDTMLAADLLYEARGVAPLVDSIDFFLAPNGYAAISDPGRTHLTRFETELKARGFCLERTTVDGCVIVEARRIKASCDLL